MSMEQAQRVRRSRASVEQQTRHDQPMTGTPVEVPVPNNVTRMRGPLLGIGFVVF